MLFIGLLWAWVFGTIAQEKARIDKEMRASVSAQAKAYAEQLDRTLSQIDYLLLSLKFHWGETHGNVKLERQVAAGLIPDENKLIVSIVDRHGCLVTSTTPFDRKTPCISKTAHFLEHQRNANAGLLISDPLIGMRTKQPKIVLSRRLEDARGMFDGIVIVAIDPDYLVSFRDASAADRDDFIAVRKSDGVFLAAKTPADKSARGPMADSYTDFTRDSGVGIAPKERFYDHIPRVVAWQKVRGYPVFSMAGMSIPARNEAFAPRKRELVMILAIGTLFLVLLAAAATLYTRWRNQQRKYRSEVRDAYRIATENTQDAFYILRPVQDAAANITDFVIEDCNDQGAVNQGIERDRLVGMTLSQLYGNGEVANPLPEFRRAMEVGYLEDEIYVPKRTAHPPRWVQRRMAKTGVGLAITVKDISTIKEHEARLEQLAHTDALTSLPNRHWLTQYLPRAIERVQHAHRPLSLLFVDLDDFKLLNDTLGHAAGDELLSAAAMRLQGVLRPTDSAVRLGGDEFMLVLESIDGESDAATIANRIIERLREPFVVAGGHAHTIKASIGISVFPRDGDNMQTLMKNADIAMYSAKEAGKGGYRFFDAHLSDQLVRRLNWQKELKHAIEHEELLLHYQPRVDAVTGEITSLEALVRWKHPEHGMVPPDAFISVAEETGLIVPLGEQVIHQACRQLAQWRRDGIPLVPVAVNVSARQINGGSVSSTVHYCMKAYAIEPALLEIEITESETVAGSKIAAEEIAALQRMELSLYVDDFGTGYSSLSQLQHLDMQGLKVDRAFTSQLAKPSGVELFRAIVSMAHAIDMLVVAEGVETVEQLHTLQALGCNEIQGYFISKPVPPDNAAALIQRKKLFPAIRP
ncbi:bifunctional diguanylate cyclase/phosphodiesterase [Noviherbaspirillum pedocola]|uniref:EAL domain-containing protein n=1 Tax=Noviherbaspirillum pedocola TaxID=2801341 RepID=A0A934W7B5_9BURK|nr:EAL domain-containing protein [Noviherbaspirillum pedocola]MBK4736165.1 EAL domain-containing protein [Noviherbaspirillum pedocola]